MDYSKPVRGLDLDLVITPGTSIAEIVLRVTIRLYVYYKTLIINTVSVEYVY